MNYFVGGALSRGAMALGLVAGVSLGASVASAGTTQIHYESLSQGTRSGFGFSVIHNPTNDQGAGNLLYRLVNTSVDAVFDDIAKTLTFTSIVGELHQELDLDPSTLGPQVGTITLATPTALNLLTNAVDGDNQAAAPGSYFLQGMLGVSITLFGGDNLPGGGDDETEGFTIQFLAKHFNALANRFDPTNNFSLGLWGATPDVFGGTNDASRRLGFDMFGEDGQIVAVPLPSVAGLGALGLLMAAGRRRSR